MVRIDNILDSVPESWWAHTATFYALTQERTASGQVTGTWEAVDGLSDIPCAIGDVEAVRNSTGAAVDTVYNAVKCYLKGYFPQVGRDMRISVDGGSQRVLDSVRHAQPAIATEVSWRLVE